MTAAPLPRPEKPQAGRVALVTGAAGTIGGAVAAELARQGAAVVAADARGADSVAAAIAAAAGCAVSERLDVTRAAEVEALVGRIVATHGRLDILVTVAGVTSLGAFADIDEAEWDRVLAVNLKGTFLCCRAVLPQMRRQRRGRIVTIGSILGKNGGNPRPWIDRAEQKGAANAAYGASKAGVHALTLYLAKDVAADGITVNSVAPGPIRSPMTTALPKSLADLIPVGRLGEAADVAAAVAYLASDAAGFVTGEILDMNGGMWMD